MGNFQSQENKGKQSPKRDSQEKESKEQSCANDSDKPVHVVLMGDSVLDNFYWLEDHKQDVRAQAEQVLGTKRPGSIVTNLALDETEAVDVIPGKRPSMVYSQARKQFGLAPYPISSDGSLHPLDRLQELLKSDRPPTHALISVGGNDVRVRLPLLAQGAGVDGVCGRLHKDGVPKAFFDIGEKLKQTGVKPIFVICYQPHAEFYEMVPRKALIPIMQNMVKEVMGMAIKNKYPVVDLANTFDYKDRSHYGSTAIEPSNKSGMFIVNLLLHVIDHHDFKGESVVYSGIGKIKSTPADVQWAVRGAL